MSGEVKDSTLLRRTWGLVILIFSSKESTGEQVRETYFNPSLVMSASTCGSRATIGRMRMAVFPSSEQQHPQSYLVHIIIRKAGNAIMRKCIWPRIFSIFDCCSCLSLNPTKCWIKSLSTQVSYQPLETEVNQSISKRGRAINGKCIQQSVNPIFQHMVPVCTFVM